MRTSVVESTLLSTTRPKYRALIALWASVLFCFFSSIAVFAQADQPLTGKAVSTGSGAENLQDYDPFVETVMRDWHIPGLAIAVVKDGRTILCRGYGIRKVGQPFTVDADTQFAIGSCTKAFTTAIIAMLVDQGKLTWDGRVSPLIPQFSLPDQHLTPEVNLRDLLSMRSGLEREPADNSLVLSGFSPVEAVTRIKYLPQKNPFRTAFSYNNQMYLAAGLIAEKLTGKQWNDLLAERLLQPLAMTYTHPVRPAFADSDNYASPHAFWEGQNITVCPIDNRNFAAAGGIYSNATDMAKWLQFQLGDGSHNGQALISRASWEELREPVIPIRGVRCNVCAVNEARVRNRFYAMGWASMDYRDRQILTHGGILDGMNSRVTLFPDEHLGIAVLSNCMWGGGKAVEVLTYEILDRFIAGKDIDWNRKFMDLQEKALAEDKDELVKRDKDRVIDTHPSCDLADYAGIYQNPVIGPMTVSAANGILEFHNGASGTHGTMEHWHYDTFLAKYDSRALGGGLLTFYLNKNGKPFEMVYWNVGNFQKVENLNDKTLREKEGG